jgi:hypothetical protein
MSLVFLLTTLAATRASPPSETCIGVKDYFCGRQSTSQFCIKGVAKACATGSKCSNVFHHNNLMDSPCVIGSSPSSSNPSSPPSPDITNRVVVDRVPSSPAQKKGGSDEGMGRYAKAGIGLGIFVGAVVFALIVVQKTAVKVKRPLTVFEQEQRDLECPYEELQTGNDLNNDLSAAAMSQKI